VTTTLDRRTFWLCWLVTYLGQAYVSMFFMYPVALQQQGISLALTGWLMSIFSVASTLIRPVGSLMSERIGVRKSLLFASLLLFVCSLPFLFFNSFSSLMVIRGSVGLFYGIVMVAVTTYQALSIPSERRGSLYAWIAIAYVLPQLSVLPLSEFFLSKVGTFAFLTLAPIIAIATFAVSKQLPRLKDLKKESKETEDTYLTQSSSEQEENWGSWKEMFYVPGFWPLVLTLLSWSFLNSSTLQYMPAFIRSRGLIASSFMAANAGVALLLRLFAIRLMDKLDRKIGSGFTIALMGAIVIVTRFASSNHSFFLLGAIYGLGMGIGFPMILALMPDIFPERLRPKGVAAGTLLIEFGFIFTPFLMSYGGSIFGLGNMLAFMGCIGCAGGLFLSLFVWRKKA
jgi:MFS family permease